LVSHFENDFADPNLLASHMFCLNETKMKNLDINSKIYNCLSQKFQILSCYDEHGTIILYDDNVSLIHNTTMTHSKVEFNTAFFNNNTCDALYVIIVYKPPKMQLSHFDYMLETFIHKMPSNCPTMIIGDFNIDLLTIQFYQQLYKQI
jgi:hypothetical protein